MREIFALLVFGMVLFAGCVSEEETPVQQQPQEEPEQVEEQEEVVEEEAPAEEPQEEEEPEVPPPAEEEYTSVAHSQDECSTLSPDCESCLAKKNCQWCKTTNACYYDGIVPTISSCNPNDWVDTVAECQGPPGGNGCTEQTNCASCLSGSGCKWCIQGSICVPESTQEECFGDWLTESYQCNYASR